MTIGAQAIEAALALFDTTGTADIEVERRESALRIAPKSGGFEANLYDQGEECMISAAQWHTHFDDPEEAAWCLRWLMSPQTRIIHELKGGILACVWIERYESGTWEAYDPAYFLNPEYPPDWRLESGQRWFHRTIWQANIPWPPGSPLPDDFAAESRTVEVDESFGLQLFGD